MFNDFRGRDYIETKDWSKDDIQKLIDFAGELKQQRKDGIPHRLLEDKTAFCFSLICLREHVILLSGSDSAWRPCSFY